MSELTIGAVRTEDGGIYTCFARNEFGHDQTAMHLLVQGIFQKPIFFIICEDINLLHDECWV